MSLGSEASSRSSQLERPQKVIGLLEVGPNCVDLLNEIFHRFNAVFSEGFADEGVVGKGNALLVDFSEASLEDEFADGLAGGVAEGDVWLHSAQQVRGGLVDAHEHSVVDLTQSQQSEDAQNFGVQLVDAANSHHEGETGLCWHVDLSCDFGLAPGSDFRLHCGGVFRLVLLGPLEGLLAELFVLGSSLGAQLNEGGCEFGVSFLLFALGLGLGWDCFLCHG